MRVGYDPTKGRIKTDARVAIDRAFVAHYHVPAAKAPAADTDGILPYTELGEEAKTVLGGFNQPAVPRNVTIVGSAANMTGSVKIYGKNFAGKAIEETITLSGTATNAKAGSKAFRVVTKVELPAQTNTPTKQKSKTQVSAGASKAGEIVVQVTGAALEEPVSVEVELTAEDSTAAKVAAAIAGALNADDAVSVAYTASAEGAYIYLEANVPAEQDDTLDLEVTEAGETGVTLGETDPDGGAAGVAPDKIAIGWGKKFGIPYKLFAKELVFLKLFNKQVESTEGTVVADADNIENNTYQPHGSPDGEKDIDLYIIV